MVTVEYDDESRMWHVIQWNDRRGQVLAKCHTESIAEQFAQSYRLNESRK
jgi:hypothetical protein